MDIFGGNLRCSDFVKNSNHEFKTDRQDKTNLTEILAGLSIIKPYNYA